MATATNTAYDVDAQETLDMPTRVGPVSAELAAVMLGSEPSANDQATKVFSLDSITGGSEPQAADAVRPPLESGVVFHTSGVVDDAAEERCTIPPVSGARAVKAVPHTPPPPAPIVRAEESRPTTLAPLTDTVAPTRTLRLTQTEIVLIASAVALSAVIASVLDLI